jgi:hypothetical protein
MAQKQLQPHHQRRALMFLLLAELLSACANAGDERVGMSLHFINRSTRAIVVLHFSPDGKEGPVPGYLGPDGDSRERNKQDSQVGARMSFMPADSNRGIPQFLEIDWVQETDRSKRDEPSAVEKPSGPKVSQKEWDYYFSKSRAEFIERRLHFKRRIDLTPILTPELLAQVRANRRNTQLKLKVVFTDDDVGITASAEVWR